MIELDYVVSYTLPATGRQWLTYNCKAINSLDAVRKCCTDVPTANIQAVFTKEELQKLD